MGGSSSKEGVSVDKGQLLVQLQGKWVGSVPVKAISGGDVAAQAVQRLKEIRLKEIPVVIQVATKGLYVINKTTGDILKEVAIEDISFVSQDTNQQSIISIFENYKELRIIASHTFRVPSKNASQLPLAINRAFAINAGKEDVDAAGKKPRKSSFKEVMQSAQKVREEAARAQDVQELLNLPGCTYYGSVQVSSSTGDAVLNDGKQRVLQLKKKMKNISLIVTDQRFILKDLKKNDIVVDNHIGDVSAAVMDSTKTELTFILHDSRLDHTACHHIIVPKIPEGETSIRRHIDAAQTAFSRKRKESMQESGEVSFKVIGNFEAVFMGSAKIRTPRSEISTKGNEAVNAVLKAKCDLENVFVQVSAEGVKRIDPLSYEPKGAIEFSTIGFSTVVKSKYWCIICPDGQNEAMVEVYRCAGERAFDIAAAITSGFKEAQKQKNSNPFAATGERTSAPETLFRKQVHRGDLKPDRAIGAGQFGVVYLATHKGKKCAVKTLRSGASEEDKAEYIRESEAILSFDHESIVGCVGVAVQQRPWLLVLEFVAHRDLKKVLTNIKANDLTLNAKEIATLCVNVCRGMEYMSSLRFIHMDLAARNVLLHTGNVCKIADFGLTRKLEENQPFWQPTKVLKMPVRWLAPECTKSARYSIESDVWACGVTMWEFYSYGALPYGQDVKNQELLRKVCNEGLRLKKPEGCAAGTWEHIAKCFHVDPAERPSFTDLVQHMQAVESKAGWNCREIGTLVADKLSGNL